MTKRVLSKLQRDDVRSNCLYWAEWNSSNPMGFTSSQLGVSPSCEFGSRVPYTAGVEAVEAGMSDLRAAGFDGDLLVVWLFREFAVDFSEVERARRMGVSLSAYQRFEDRTFVVIHAQLVAYGVVTGKKIAS